MKSKNIRKRKMTKKIATDNWKEQMKKQQKKIRLKQIY